MVQIKSRPPVEIADILRAHGAAYRASHPVSPAQGRVMTNLSQCRTAALGGHVDTCGRCGFVRISYNSCRDRHCPKCQAADREAWIDTRLERILPVEYFHVVFTLPEQLQPLVLQNQRLLYGLLFQAAAETLLQLGRDPKRLGGQLGFTAVLHTWGQNLLFHPHLHCVVTGGGLSRDGTTWVAAREGYLLPVKVLGRLFRGKFLSGLRDAFGHGKLKFQGSTADLADACHFRKWLRSLYRRDWVVYAKPPFGGAEQVYRYLGRYTHRVAISNSRLVSFNDDGVRFRYKDYADEDRIKEMVLSPDEFIRRFLLHVLPKGFVRIRHYGLLASRNVPTKLARARELLAGGTAGETRPRSAPNWLERLLAWVGDDFTCCPHCHGPLQRQSFERHQRPKFASRETPRLITRWDTS
jgi:hypothetical protein